MGFWSENIYSIRIFFVCITVQSTIQSSVFYVLGPFHTMLAIEIFHSPLNRGSSFLLTLLFYSPLAFLMNPGIRGGAHRERRLPAGQQHSVCRLRSVRQRHPGGPQHRLRPQLLHAGPGEFTPLIKLTFWVLCLVFFLYRHLLYCDGQHWSRTVNTPFLL